MESDDRRICIVGMGYVGLTLSVVMAECGFRVLGIEINRETIAKLERGTAHFYEAGIDSRLQRQLRNGNIQFVTTHEDERVRGCTTYIVTVGTPLDADGNPRMDMVQRAAREVAASMDDGALVILRSTVRVGTSRNVVMPILAETGRRFDLAYCPERTIEGRALEELRRLPQVIGGISEEAAWRATRLFNRMTPTTIRVSSLEAAEMIKLLDNSYRDLFFSFGNEVALLCESAGLDGIEIINAANTGYERTNIARPGLVGGPCLEKDPHILHHSAKSWDFTPQLIVTGRRLNERLPSAIAESIASCTPDELRDREIKISVCGMAFKGRPETDDLRGTPSRLVIDALRARFPRARIHGQDFAVSPEAIASLGVEPATVDEAFADAHVVVIANNNTRYQFIRLNELMETMARPAILYDCWDCLEVERHSTPAGVTYYRLGSVAAWRAQA
jgi:UDP-N-acetyl-D-mannosaminuronic acid dehydrogenase